jgi:hypothetical protein
MTSRSNVLELETARLRHTHKCKKCDAAITWVRIEKSGKAMPLNAESSPFGQYVLSLSMGGDEVLGVWAPKSSEPRHVSHFVTCPFAAAFRKKKNNA